jgi:ATP/maltotriose-dependent transcriptional regulator MalT
MIALSGALLFGPTPAEDGIVRFDELLARSRGTASYQRVLRRFAKLLAMRDRFPEARTALADAREVIAEIGVGEIALHFLEADAGMVELDAAAPSVAERLVRPALEGTPRANVWQRAGLSLTLAQALFDQRRFDEAQATLDGGGTAADAHQPFWHVWWLALEAQLLATRGDRARARRVAGKADQAARKTDDPVAQGNALLALAAAGVPDAASRAVRRFRAKGCLPGLRRLDDLTRG